MGRLLFDAFDSAGPSVDSFDLVDVLAVRENVLRLTFSSPIYFSSVLDPGDASNADRYAIIPDASSLGSDGQPPRPVLPRRAELFSSNQVDLWVDRRLSPCPSVYVVQVNGLVADDTFVPLRVITASCFGLRAGVPAPTPDNAFSNADIANPQTLSGALDPLPLPNDSVLGTLPVDDTGDIAKDEGLASYKKRVLRRLTTRKGKFAHLPDYGTLFVQSVKQLGRSGLLQQLAADAEAQVKQEPETVEASVQIIFFGGVAFFRVRARCSFGTTVNLLSPVNITG